ncbi:Holliday junction resolvase RuvX [candidate division KSB1 bacterium]
MGRVLAIDYGDRRVGLAVSDPDRLISFPRGFITWSGKRELMGKLAEFCRENEIGTVVVGLPRSLNGEEGPRAQLTRKWAGELQQTLKLEISFWDERFSSRQAQREIHSMGERVGKRKGRVDEIAASLLLQSYLDYSANSTET